MTPTVTPLDDSRALRATLGQFATGVAIVTARHVDGRRAGVTVNSLASMSLDPPLVLWSLAIGAASRSLFVATRHHAINVLAADQAHLAQRFSARTADRFAGVGLRDGPFGSLLLEDTLSQLVCRVRDLRETGDHLLFVSEVVHHRHIVREPLIFHGSRYWRIGPQVDTAARPTAHPLPEVA